MPTSMAPGVERKRERLSLENQGGVGGVVNDDQVVLLGEIDDSAKNFGVAEAPVGLFG